MKAKLFIESGYEKPTVIVRDSVPEDGVGILARPLLLVVPTGEEYWGFHSDLSPWSDEALKPLQEKLDALYEDMPTVAACIFKWPRATRGAGGLVYEEGKGLRFQLVCKSVGEAYEALANWKAGVIIV
jgi:hypothetical protein